MLHYRSWKSKWGLGVSTRQSWNRFMIYYFIGAIHKLVSAYFGLALLCQHAVIESTQKICIRTVTYKMVFQDCRPPLTKCLGCPPPPPVQSLAARRSGVSAPLAQGVLSLSPNLRLTLLFNFNFVASFEADRYWFKETQATHCIFPFLYSRMLINETGQRWVSFAKLPWMGWELQENHVIHKSFIRQAMIME